MSHSGVIADQRGKSNSSMQAVSVCYRNAGQHLPYVSLRLRCASATGKWASGWRRREPR